MATRWRWFLLEKVAYSGQGCVVIGLEKTSNICSPNSGGPPGVPQALGWDTGK